jgi:hypothetical protein
MEAEADAVGLGLAVACGVEELRQPVSARTESESTRAIKSFFIVFLLS